MEQERARLFSVVKTAKSETKKTSTVFPFLPPLFFFSSVNIQTLFRETADNVLSQQIPATSGVLATLPSPIGMTQERAR